MSTIIDNLRARARGENPEFSGRDLSEMGLSRPFLRLQIESGMLKGRVTEHEIYVSAGDFEEWFPKARASGIIGPGNRPAEFNGGSWLARLVLESGGKRVTFKNADAALAADLLIAGTHGVTISETDNRVARFEAIGRQLAEIGAGVRRTGGGAHATLTRFILEGHPRVVEQVGLRRRFCGGGRADLIGE